MLFHTSAFAAFFVVAFVAAWATRSRPAVHLWTLTAFSFAFYAVWDWRFAFLLAASCVGNHWAGLAVARAEGPSRTRLVALAVAGNLAVLAAFKYYDFFIASANALAVALGLPDGLPYAGLILPVGISFYTFQGISYVVDVHRREIRPSTRLVETMLYIALFPQLVAGPILRAADMLPQIRARWTPVSAPERLALGFAAVMILSGLFKKLVLANHIATGIVDEAFFAPSDYGAADLWLAAYGYTIQIWCDFSGYSDMAIGLGALLGFRFMANFDQPFRATSMRDFWRRWHISLSTWLRDYLYKPMGGSRGGAWLTGRNLFLTMLLGGLWHGAAWTFVLWGAIHGAALVIERAVGPVVRGRAGAVLGWLVTFHVVVFTFVLFRSESLPLFSEFLAGLVRFEQMPMLATPFLTCLVLGALALHLVPPGGPVRAAAVADRLPWPLLGLMSGAILAGIGFLAPDAITPFIYFQF
ncbi:MAG: MBOAT family protein [Rhodobacteraceae bacterium]|jgi:D-alanyl-lipoteichoic acid acyltransferase DltB (MBOAT superfamily)|nr:MBOAT family protein [Paracoccaceae bacterium]